MFKHLSSICTLAFPFNLKCESVTYILYVIYYVFAGREMGGGMLANIFAGGTLTKLLFQLNVTSGMLPKVLHIYFLEVRWHAHHCICWMWGHTCLTLVWSRPQSHLPQRFHMRSNHVSCVATWFTYNHHPSPSSSLRNNHTWLAKPSSGHITL